MAWEGIRGCGRIEQTYGAHIIQQFVHVQVEDSQAL
jgi:hypothetical protein